jgi:hypothetical protein
VTCACQRNLAQGWSATPARSDGAMGRSSTKHGRSQPGKHTTCQQLRIRTKHVACQQRDCLRRPRYMPAPTMPALLNKSIAQRSWPNIREVSHSRCHCRRCQCTAGRHAARPPVTPDTARHAPPAHQPVSSPSRVTQHHRQPKLPVPNALRPRHHYAHHVTTGVPACSSLKAFDPQTARHNRRHSMLNSLQH